MGLHFWPSWSYLSGLRIDYFSPTIYFTDILILLILSFWLVQNLLAPRSSDRVRAKRGHSGNPAAGGGVQNLLRVIPAPCLPAGRKAGIYPIFILFIFLNIYFSINPPVTFFHWFRILELIFLGFWVSKNFFRFSPNSIFYVLASSVILQSFIVLGQFFHQGSLGGIFYWLGEIFYHQAIPGIAQANFLGNLILRPYGTFSHPNILAGFFVTLYPLTLNYLKKCYDKRGSFLEKIFLAASVIIAPIMVIMTISRLAVFVMTAEFIILSFPEKFPSFPRISPKNFFLSFSVLLFLVILASVARPESDPRLLLNFEALKLFLNHPLIGLGLGTFPQAIFSGISYQPVHNLYLLILSETGIIGFSLFLVLIIETLKNLLQIENCKLKIVLAVILFLGFFDHYFLTAPQTQLLFAIILGLCHSSALPAGRQERWNLFK